MKKKKNRGAKRERLASPLVANGMIEPPEQGLSVDPDELGPSFLRYATEQGNFETARAVPREFAPPVGPASDDAPRESATPAGNLWERTVEMSATRTGVDPEKLDEPFEPEAAAPDGAPRDPT